MSDWYQIENSYFTVQFNSTGAEMKRLFSKPWHRELLWVPQDESAQKIWNRSAPVLFPIVGKLKNDTYKFKDKEYVLSQHGFARDQNFKCLVCSTHEIEFLLEASQETFKVYPFCFELKVNYTLQDKKIIITYTVKNVDRQDIFFSIGAHPAFDTARLADYSIVFEKEEFGFYQLQNGLVNWKQIFSLENNKLIPTKEMFAKDALIFKELKSQYVDLVDSHRHEVIRLHRGNAPYFGIWAKESVPFICLEPWFGVSDDQDHNQNLESKKGIRKLAMGASFVFSYSLELITITSEMP